MEAQLKAAGISFGYETLRLPVSYPPRVGRCTPDFECYGTDIVLETKGWFGKRGAAERQKWILAKEQNPHLDIRFIFDRSGKKVDKRYSTTYADWAEKHGFKWADRGTVPEEWLTEIKQKGKAHDPGGNPPTDAKRPARSRSPRKARLH